MKSISNSSDSTPKPILRNNLLSLYRVNGIWIMKIWKCYSFPSLYSVLFPSLCNFHPWGSIIFIIHSPTPFWRMITLVLWRLITPSFFRALNHPLICTHWDVISFSFLNWLAMFSTVAFSSSNCFASISSSSWIEKLLQC